jgi:hypothetical protein
MKAVPNFTRNKNSGKTLSTNIKKPSNSNRILSLSTFVKPRSKPKESILQKPLTPMKPPSSTPLKTPKFTSNEPSSSAISNNGIKPSMTTNVPYNSNPLMSKLTSLAPSPTKKQKTLKPLLTTLLKPSPSTPNMSKPTST